MAFLFFFLVWLLVFVADLATGHASRDDCGADLGGLLISHAYARDYVCLHVLSWRLVGDVTIVVVRLATGQVGATAVLLMLREVVRRAVLRLSLQVPHVRRLHIAA